MPSRTDVPEYAEYLERIEALVAVVNHRHGTPDWMPIQLKLRDDLEEAVAAYKHYDVLLVNAMFDGMNLVAKEGPLVNERDGVSILSENTGAHEELGEYALSVNPFDIQELADSIHAALTMAPAERARRARGLKDDRHRARPGRLDRRPARRHPQEGRRRRRRASSGSGRPTRGERGGRRAAASAARRRGGAGVGRRRRCAAAAAAARPAPARGAGACAAALAARGRRRASPRPRARLLARAALRAAPRAPARRGRCARAAGSPPVAAGAAAGRRGTAAGGGSRARGRPGAARRRPAAASADERREPGDVGPADPRHTRRGPSRSARRAAPRTSPPAIVRRRRPSSANFSWLHRTPLRPRAAARHARAGGPAREDPRRRRGRSSSARRRSSASTTGACARWPSRSATRTDAEYHLLQFHGPPECSRARAHAADHRRRRPLPDHQARAGHARAARTCRAPRRRPAVRRGRSAPTSAPRPRRDAAPARRRAPRRRAAAGDAGRSRLAAA